MRTEAGIQTGIFIKESDYLRIKVFINKAAFSFINNLNLGV